MNFTSINHTYIKCIHKYLFTGKQHDSDNDYKADTVIVMCTLKKKKSHVYIQHAYHLKTMQNAGRVECLLKLI